MKPGPHADQIWLCHMLDAGREALSFVKGRSRNDLNSNRMLLLSLVKELEIIGEASVKISPEFKAGHAEPPWELMAGIRNRLIHAYFDIDLDIIWETVSKRLPALVKALKPMVRP